MAKQDPRTGGEPTAPNAEGAAPGTAVEVLRLPTPEVTVNVPLDERHLVSVVIAETEVKLSRRLDAAMAESLRHGAIVKQKHEELVALVKEHGSPDMAKKVDGVVKAMSALGLKVVVKYTYGDCRKDHQYSVEAKAEVRGDGSYGSFGTSGLQSMTPAMIQLAKEIAAGEAEQRHQTAIAADARRRLARIDQLRRQAEAKLAKIIMQRTPEGREMYDKLIEELDADIDGMPVLRSLEDGSFYARSVTEVIVSDGSTINDDE